MGRLGCAVAGLLACATSCTRVDGVRGIAGIVRDHVGPVAGAVVRVQTTEVVTTTAADGSFWLAGEGTGVTPSLTAWAPGYYIAGGEPVRLGTNGVVLNLVPHSDRDNPAYKWVSAFAAEGRRGACQECHSDPQSRTSALPFDEWRQDAHGRSGQNVRFTTMYRGTDILGRRSPLARYGYSRDYGRSPVRPDPTKPYFGPGYKLDFPSGAGNCAACHEPGAAINAPYDTDLASVSAAAAEGISCDFCHKVWDVKLDPATGRPHPNNPGVLSFEFRRPADNHQLFVGPLDDVAPGEDSYSPLMRRSQFCAPCHVGTFWDTKVYNSFGEWLESPYSDPASGKACQDCHMPRGLTDHFARLDKGGRRRNPSTIASHRMLGASDERFLRDAVTMTVSGAANGHTVVVDVVITNDKTGHHVPTDSPLRQLILVVDASDGDGRPLPFLEGPTVPVWGGIGDPATGYYAGKPGKLYAKVLAELWTGVAPTGAYWNHTQVVSDNRIPALASERSRYAFLAPVDGPANVEVRLVFRRAFKALMDQKGWDDPDIVMAEKTISVR